MNSSASTYAAVRQSIDEDEEKTDAEAAILSPTQRPPTRPRNNSLRFSFDAVSRLAIPFSQDDAQQRDTKAITLLDGLALVIGSQIGSGIFASPGVLLADVGSSGAALCIWIGSGFLAWTGAASFAELGCCLPLNGGAQAYLQYSFGPLAGYLFAWTAITAVKPASAGAIALIFGEYMSRVLYHTAFTASAEEAVKAIPRFVIQIVAISAISLVSLLNILSDKIGTRTQIVLTVCKLAALAAIIIIGLVQLIRGKVSSGLQGNIFADSSSSPGHYALALFSGLWAYDGWEATNYVAGEMKQVARDLPRTIHLSMSTVILLYGVANVAYLIVLPKELVSNSNTVALEFARVVLGPFGALCFALIVAASCFGALNGGLFTSARLIAVVAREGFLPKTFAKLHSTRSTPTNAVLLQSSLTILMILFGDFKSLVVFLSICSWTFYLATVLSLLVLRIKEPDLARPYRTWLITPLTFSVVALFLLLMPIFSSPFEAMLAFIFIGSGVPFYYLTYHSASFVNYIQAFREQGFQMKGANGYHQTESEER